MSIPAIRGRRAAGTACLVALAASLALASCASAPSPREKELEALWAPSGKAWPSKAKFMKPSPWRAGQYVVTGTRSKGRVQSTSRMLLVAKEKTGWVIEVSNRNAKGEDTLAQYLLEGYDAALKSGDTAGLRFAWMRTRNKDGTISTMSGPDMDMINAMSKATMETMVVSAAAFTDGGEVVVPAGSFPGTNKVESTVKVLGMSVSTTAWYQASVPVNGMVRSVSGDGKTVVELLSFGSDGKPEMPAR